MYPKIITKEHSWVLPTVTSYPINYIIKSLCSIQIHRTAKLISALQLMYVLSQLMQLYSISFFLSPSHVCVQPKISFANWVTKRNLSQWSLSKVLTRKASNSTQTLSLIFPSIMWLLSCNMIRPRLLVIFIIFRPSSYSAWRDPRSFQPHPTTTTKFPLAHHEELWLLFIWS